MVRGADLIGSTPWQIELQNSLSLSRPIYGHLPLLLEPDGNKLSKSRRALPVDRGDQKKVAEALFSTLTLLSQLPPPDGAHNTVKDLWEWALEHWDPQALAGRTRLPLSARGDR